MIRSETNSTLNSQFVNLNNNNHNNNGSQFPIAQPSVNNNYSTMTMPDTIADLNENDCNLNERKFKKWQTSPTLSMSKLREDHIQKNRGNNNNHQSQSMNYGQSHNPHRINQRYNTNNNNSSTPILHSKGPNTYFHGSNHHNLYNRINENSHRNGNRPQTQPNPQSRHRNNHETNHHDNQLLPDDMHIPLRKINSAPYRHRSEVIYTIYI